MTDPPPYTFLAGRYVLGLVSCAAAMSMLGLLFIAWKNLGQVRLTGTTVDALSASLGGILTALVGPLIGCCALAVVAGWSLDAALEGPGNAARRWFQIVSRRP